MRTWCGWAYAAALASASLCACVDDAGGFGDPRPVGPTKQPVRAVAGPRPPPDFASALRVEPSFSPATSTVVVRVSLPAGFHAYAQGETTGKPIDLRVVDHNGWRLAAPPTLPAGRVQDLGDGGTSVILEGDFLVSGRVTGGLGAVRGELLVHVCTADTCDRPRTYAFEVPTT